MEMHRESSRLPHKGVPYGDLSVIRCLYAARRQLPFRKESNVPVPISRTIGPGVALSAWMGVCGLPRRGQLGRTA